MTPWLISCDFTLSPEEMEKATNVYGYSFQIHPYLWLFYDAGGVGTSATNLVEAVAEAGPSAGKVLVLGVADADFASLGLDQSTQDELNDYPALRSGNGDELN